MAPLLVTKYECGLSQRSTPKTLAQINILYQWCVTVLMGYSTILHVCPSVKAAFKSRPCNTIWGEALLICCTGPNVGTEQNKHPLDSHWKTEQVGSCMCCRGAHISNPASTLLNWVSTKHNWVRYQPVVALLSETKLCTKKQRENPAHCAGGTTSNNPWKMEERHITEGMGEMCFDRPVTVVALKRLSTGVFAVVPRQLVAPGESPLAAFPRALVRLLTWGMKKKHA